MEPISAAIGSLGCLSLLFIILILLDSGGAAHKLLWIVLVIVLPCLGPILYLVLSDATKDK